MSLTQLRIFKYMYKDSCDKLRELWQGSCGKIRLRVCARLYRCAEEAKEKEEEEEQKNVTDKASQKMKL